MITPTVIYTDGQKHLITQDIFYGTVILTGMIDLYPFIMKEVLSGLTI
jgi:hypothetical protein